MKEHREQEASTCCGARGMGDHSLENAAGTRTMPPARTGQQAVPTTPETRAAQQHAAGFVHFTKPQAGSSFPHSGHLHRHCDLVCGSVTISQNNSEGILELKALD